MEVEFKSTRFPPFSFSSSKHLLCVSFSNVENGGNIKPFENLNPLRMLSKNIYRILSFFTLHKLFASKQISVFFDFKLREALRSFDTVLRIFALHQRDRL